jgi:hypothetical protein
MGQGVGFFGTYVKYVIVALQRCRFHIGCLGNLFNVISVFVFLKQNILLKNS